MESVDYYKQIYSVGTVVTLNPAIPSFLFEYFHVIEKAVVVEAIRFFDEDAKECFSSNTSNDKILNQHRILSRYCTVSYVTLQILESSKGQYPFKGELYHPDTLILLQEDVSAYIDIFYAELELYTQNNMDMREEEYDDLLSDLRRKQEAIKAFMGEPIYIVCSRTLASIEKKPTLPKFPTL